MADQKKCAHPSCTRTTSLTASSKVPLNSCSFVKKHLRSAAKAAGSVQIADGQHFGLHNLRHSLSNWLVKAKVEPKTVQGILRHSKIQTTRPLHAGRKR